MFNHKSLARRLTEARGKVRPAAWARKIGLSAGELARMEDGEEPPTLETLHRIHVAAGVDLTWIITGQGPKYSPTILAANEPVPAPPGKAPRKRDFSDLSLAQLAAGLIADTSLPKREREMVGDLIITAVNSPRDRETIILIHRFLKFAKLHQTNE